MSLKKLNIIEINILIQDFQIFPLTYLLEKVLNYNTDRKMRVYKTVMRFQAISLEDFNKSEDYLCFLSPTHFIFPELIL